MLRLMEKVVLQLFSERLQRIPEHGMASGGDQASSSKITLLGTSLPSTSQGDVIQLETQGLSQDCTLGVGIPSL